MVMVAIVNEGDYIIDTMGWFGSYHNQLYKINNLKTQHYSVQNVKKKT